MRARVPGADLVWFIDEDVRLPGFACAAFLDEWARHRPAVSQPLVSPSTQGYSLSKAVWAELMPNATSLATRYVEQQTPLFRSDFLRWFARQDVVARVVAAQRHFNHAWGLDVIWCGAALAWGSQCRIIGTAHVEHADAVSLRHKKGSKFLGSYVRTGFALYAAAGVRRDLTCWPPKKCELHAWTYLPHSHGPAPKKEARARLQKCNARPAACLLP